MLLLLLCLGVFVESCERAKDGDLGFRDDEATGARAD
jgi:hypothetical protein